MVSLKLGLVYSMLTAVCTELLLLVNGVFRDRDDGRKQSLVLLFFLCFTDGRSVLLNLCGRVVVVVGFRSRCRLSRWFVDSFHLQAVRFGVLGISVEEIRLGILAFLLLKGEGVGQIYGEESFG
ncbi:hypothetical protein F5Y17DRAFT_170829 [Xylariaceae sp. FL0594]|nr:hypothetical protein F5Y17DRAFT_170829 [Xylariaceae sp. FL0594]